MRTLLCDADIPDPVITAINALKIPAVSVKSIPGTADNDAKVVDVANTLDAIIITLDRDYTSQPLFAAMVQKGAKIVRLRPSKCEPYEVIENIASMIIKNHREWQKLLSDSAGVISCSSNGNRLRNLEEFPWYKK
ncbi:MAG: hypothetical protein A2158_05505 [Chloroflexi bacterium RBG_13_46_14]|nr:MAG: hypothetical protein A2158_05505 [Chloroflexi bacterium RBG_13_46_14]